MPLCDTCKSFPTDKSKRTLKQATHLCPSTIKALEEYSNDPDAMRKDDEDFLNRYIERKLK